MNAAPLLPAPDLIAAASAGLPAPRDGGVAHPAPAHLSHHRAAARQRQALWLGFGGRADQPWLRLLRPGFRHCFAGIEDGAGWTVLDPLSGRLMVTRLEVPACFDLPGFWRRAGCKVLGPFEPAAPAPTWPSTVPFSCVALCRALLGPGAPFALTPYGLYRALQEKKQVNWEKILDPRDGSV